MLQDNIANLSVLTKERVENSTPVSNYMQGLASVNFPYWLNTPLIILHRQGVGIPAQRQSELVENDFLIQVC